MPKSGIRSNGHGSRYGKDETEAVVSKKSIGNIVRQPEIHANFYMSIVYHACPRFTHLHILNSRPAQLLWVQLPHQLPILSIELLDELLRILRHSLPMLHFRLELLLHLPTRGRT